MKITPFKSAIPTSALDDLKLRINNTRWPDELENVEWSLGTSMTDLKKLCSYWAESYSWEKTEREINEYPNFIAEIDGFNIHFIHVKGKSKTSVPLVITHGWPGSFLEMLQLIPLLTEDPAFSFDLVIPSVIGFGFSGKATQPGCNSERIADLWCKLMTGLGYDRFGAQGGDIGAGISSWLSKKYPENIIGLHLNYVPGSFKPYLRPGEALAPEVIEFQQKLSTWVDKEGAYSRLHSTKPQTLAYGLNDSPVGLCAWILEKFHSWTDNNGNLESIISKDELLGNITLYWLTQTLPSSIRIYAENSKAPLSFAEHEFIYIPVAFAEFPKELPTPPRSFVEKGYNIKHWTKMPIGGHFAALEQPELLSEDLISFFKKISWSTSFII
jgi:pimeloyl-ACP methyl ester carboxylesterase